MRLTPLTATGLIWVGWIASWLIAALWASRAVARAPTRAELGHRAVTLAGALLIAGAIRAHHGPLAAPLWRLPGPTQWVCVAVLLAGVAFAWWARLHLGPLWSGSITRKADHRIVDTGPYAIVRHPIYTGILAGVLATALLRGTTLGLIGFPLMAIGFAMKARIEERFLAAGLGADDYARYAARVPMLLPFAPR